MENELTKKIFGLIVPSTSEPASFSDEISRIARGARIVGDMSSRTDIRVDGCIEGKIFSEGRITVGGSAVLKGSLVCSDVDFYGKMEGDLFVKGVLSVKSPAVINGNIHVCKLQVELGAQINGSCSMITDEEFENLKSGVITTEVPEYAVVKKGGNSMKLPSAQEEQARFEAKIASSSGSVPVQRPSAGKTVKEEGTEENKES